MKESVVTDSKRHQLEKIIESLASAIPFLNKDVRETVPVRLIPKHIYISDLIILSASV